MFTITNDKRRTYPTQQVAGNKGDWNNEIRITRY